MTLALALSILLQPGPNLDDYVGRYAKDQLVVMFTRVDDRLCVRPINWDGRQQLRHREGDRFYMDFRTPRDFVFSRGENGRVSRVEISGMEENGTFLRLGEKLMPLELILDGKAASAAAEFQKAGVSSNTILSLVRRMGQSRPSKAKEIAAFLFEHAKKDRSPQVLASLGTAQIAVGDRRAAEASYLAALAGDPSFEGVQQAIRMIRGNHEGGWTVPFPLKDVYVPPTKEEISRVESIWAKRDLSPRGARREDSYKLTWLGGSYTVEVVSHLVSGERHYGAILTPEGASQKSCPVLVEVKGVSWNFFPLGIPEGSSALRILGPEAQKFVLVMPGFRGERLLANDKWYTSEGNPAESWDYATDDAIALLNVALQRTPQADSERVVAFGRSRGGTVAALLGIRDKRVDLVLAWSGPAGWIEQMVQQGWTQRELVGEGMRSKSEANQIGGQAIRTFLKQAIDGKENLEQVRNRLIASSPIYFSNRLPKAELWYGADDHIVPLNNADAWRQVIAQDAQLAKRSRVVIYDQGGHDLDTAAAFRDGRNRLLKFLTETR